MTAPNVTAPLPMPSKPQERGASTTISQRDRRWTDTFYDDYRHPRFPNGRPFTGEREFKSGVSEQSVSAGFLTADLQCGEFFCENPAQGQTPLERQMTLESAWSAPFLLPGGKKYMNFNYARKRITWRYDAFIADERSGLARFWDACALAAGPGEVVDPRQPDALAFRLRRIFGSPRNYINKIKLAQACMAGDPWIMGAVDTPNEELAKLLGQHIQYLGAPLNFGDAEYVAAPAPTPPAPVLTPEQVLSVPVSEVQAMIEAALAKRDADEKARRKAMGDRLAAGKAKKKAEREKTQGPASMA